MTKVQYNYDAAAPWTELDQQLVDAMEGLVEMENAMEVDIRAALERAGKVRERVKELDERCTEVRSVLQKAQTGATEYVAALRLGKSNLSEAFTEAVNDANDAIYEQNQAFGHLHEAYSAVCDDHKALVERMDEEGEAWDGRMHEVIIKACSTDDLATDAVSYDVAHQELLGVLSMDHDHRKDMLQCMLDVLSEYDLLHERISGQQDVWVEFCERLKMIELMGNDHSGMVQVGLN